MASHRHMTVALACAVLAGCASLLPHGRAVDVSPFASYEAAHAAFVQVQPYRTTVDELKALGFDAAASPNVEQVPYPQWIGLLVHPNVPLERTDGGIRDCVDAAEACRAYLFRFGRLERERAGHFVADFFNFRRIVRTQGWRFEGVVLMRDGLVLFRSHGGQPKLETVDDRSNPLGPLQGLGESPPDGLKP